jgi:phosphomannomutase / phosphoglucomutase
MAVDPTIFREYDIRGLVDRDLTTEAVELIGRAYAAFARARSGAKTVTVGRDCRDHSPRLSGALKAGLTAGGLDVIDVGVVTTPMLYFSIFHFKADGGVQITGSHNPPEYNGLKVCLGTSSLHGPEIQELRRIIEADRWTDAPRGDVVEKDVAAAYADYCTANIRMGKRRLKVVVDAGNGTAGPFAVPILRKLGVDVIPLYCEMDATFPNHHPDPTVEKNLKDLIARVKAEKADVGLAYDGDADRLGAVDENGDILWGDQMMILFSRAILRDKPGATIVAEVKCSQTLYDDIEKHGGKALMWKTGHSLIKGKMKETGAELAGEMSGHIFFKHRYFGFDDGIYAGLRLLEILSETDRPLSTLLADVPKMFNTPEIRVDCPEDLKFRLVAACVEHFKAKHRVIDVDGARILFPDGWGLIRASNTQPLLVLRFEATTQTRLDEIKRYVEREMEAVRKSGLRGDVPLSP